MTGDSEIPDSMPPPHIYVERTLAIIKPDAVHKAEEIEDIILRSGFAILQVCFNVCQKFSSLGYINTFFSEI